MGADHLIDLWEDRCKYSASLAQRASVVLYIFRLNNTLTRTVFGNGLAIPATNEVSRAGENEPVSVKSGGYAKLKQRRFAAAVVADVFPLSRFLFEPNNLHLHSRYGRYLSVRRSLMILVSCYFALSLK